MYRPKPVGVAVSESNPTSSREKNPKATIYKKVSRFVKSFREEFSRDPTTEEVQDNLQDNVVVDIAGPSLEREPPSEDRENQ